MPEFAIIAPERPFYSGEERSGECDYLPPTADFCCDAPSAYEVWWKPVPEHDGDSKPVSGVCLAHVVHVDRALVERMETHPDALAAQGGGENG